MIKLVDSKEEIQKCDELLTKLIHDEKKYDNSIDDSFEVKDYFINVICNELNVLLVDIEDEEIVGYIFAKVVSDDCAENITGYLIDGLYVEEKYRNKNIAKNLIEEAIKRCKDNNAAYIDINTMYKNENAINIYKKFGFNEFSIRLRKEL